MMRDIDSDGAHAAAERDVPEHYPVGTVGVMRSPFKQKFGIPRQPGLVPAATALLELLPPFTLEDVAGIEDFSHLW